MSGLWAVVDWRGAASAAVRAAIDVVVPPQCLLCRCRTLAPASLCPACWRNLNFIEAPCCDRLGLPFAFDQGEGALSAAALADPPVWDRARAAVAFDEASRGLVHALKYRDHHEAGLLMARLMLRAGRPLFANAHALVPVPLHRWRLWQRRFNQSALLAQDLSRQTGLSYRPGLLDRVRATPRQVGLDHAARRKNVRRAFSVPSSARPDLVGMNIVLIDDVLTTGATAAACTDALKQAGAKRVDILAFALVLEPRHIHI